MGRLSLHFAFQAQQAFSNIKTAIGCLQIAHHYLNFRGVAGK